MTFDQIDSFSGKHFPDDPEDSPVGHVALGFFTHRHDITIVTSLDDFFRARIGFYFDFNVHEKLFGSNGGNDSLRQLAD
jgi:hypothetical protein